MGKKMRNNGTILLKCAAVAGSVFSAVPASAATISRSIEVNAPVAEVWSSIGPFCAIKEWLPPVGQCVEDGKNPPTRILLTKDGKSAFVEKQTGRSEHSYSYTFLSSPLPVTKYTSTIKVIANGDASSTITWSGTFTPDPGKGEVARAALNGVYEAGLKTIVERLAR